MIDKNPLQVIKSLKIIHWAITLGPVIFGISIFFIISDDPDLTLIHPDDPLTYIPIGMAFVIAAIQFFLFKNLLKENTKGKTDLHDKLMAYQSAHIARVALLEGVSLFSVVSCLTNNSLINFLTAGVITILLILLAPTVSNISDSLNLTRSESQLLEAKKSL